MFSEFIHLVACIRISLKFFPKISFVFTYLEEGVKRERSLSLVHSPVSAQWGLGQSAATGQELSPHLLQAWQGPHYLSHRCCLPGQLELGAGIPGRVFTAAPNAAPPFFLRLNTVPLYV